MQLKVGEAMDAAAGKQNPLSERPSTLINSVQRAIHLLEAVAGHPSAVPAKMLAKEVGLPLGTTYHLLRTLTYEGYLRRLPDGLYVLGEGVIKLLDEGRTQAGLSRARASMVALTDHVGAAAYLCLYEEGEIVIKEITDTPRHPRIDLWVGFHDGAHATALGKSVLAALDPEQLNEYLSQHTLPDLTPHTLTTRESLQRTLEDVRRNGFALDQQEYAIGTICVGVPVVAEELIAAVAVSLPQRRRAEMKSLVRPLKYTAQRISRALAVAN